ncbi:hypothetical protein GCM10011533_30450 [Streptosporangium jomthongense]|uniref:Uncharacterized protein n=1 Tax=Marinobacter aromaticivorans TaxID=1494078 RepID=A0ABW2IYY8_9GAMM|nr:hypothetical protein [Marinobacter aromaticivorans]GGE75982.1 hypothetical protein GCM10011533_30450 [Streptosporangium jomthongense]
MDISPAHEAARVEASRLPALYASLELLKQPDPQAAPATLEIYGTPRPVAGDPPGGAPIVTLELIRTAGTIDDELIEMRLAVPISAQIAGADPATGTIPEWGRIKQPDGAWWSDCSVSVDGGTGELQMPQTGTEGGSPVARLFNGATALISSAVFRG